MADSLVDFMIPENSKGKATSVEQCISLDNVEEAKTVFKTACGRMHDVNSWHKLAGIGSAEFSVKDTHGLAMERPVQLYDYLRIDIPGPGPSTGDGYDWVQVEALENRAEYNLEQESCGMRVRSCKYPNKDSDTTAHFFTNDATSTFIIHRRQNIVTSYYYGRNEILNTGTEKTIDKVRNALTGAAALAGISKLQWLKIIKSFIEQED